jgi:Xaa-Pro aminopeptidase
MTIFDERMARLRARMAATGTDLVVLGPSSHMVWLSGLTPHGDERPVLLVVGKDAAGFLMPALNADSQRPGTALPFFTWSDAEGPDAALAALLDSLGARRPGLRIVLDETMRADFALLVIDALPGAAREFTGATVGWLRAQKDEAEYKALKANALLNDRAMQAAFAALRPGVSEYEIATVLREYYKAHGATTEFVSVCFGENGAFPHHTVGQRKLGMNEAVLIDTGGRSDGYPSDMTRVGYSGEAPTEYFTVHAVLERAVRAAVDAARPGIPARLVDKAARDVIAGAGYGEFFLHRTGHGLGIDIHEPPYITATSETILEEGNVFSIEPGIYLSGRFGIRLEEIVILRNGKAEVLSELSRAPFRMA